jgi:hypothetical protein
LESSQQAKPTDQRLLDAGELAPVGSTRSGADVVDYLVHRISDGIIDNQAALLQLRNHLVGDFGRLRLTDLRSQLLLELPTGLRLGEPRVFEFLSVQVAGDKPDEAENQ